MAPKPLRPTKLHIETPLIYSSLLSQHANCHIYLKLENTQPSGSFKTRGIGALALASITPSTPTPHLVCSSGGNAGLACAYAAQTLSLPCTIFVPSSTKAAVVERIKMYGAQVVMEGAHWAEADKGARELVESEEDAVYIPPFDHPTVVEGNSTIVPEWEKQLRLQGRKADAIICSVGGGGLLAGILTGLASSGSSIPVLACETSGAASLAASLEASFAVKPFVPRLERLVDITSIATTLGATAVSMTALQLAVEHPAGVVSVVTEDARAIAAVRSFATDHGFFVEPACAVSLVPIYFPEVLWLTLPTLFGEEAIETQKDLPVIVVIVCGGNTFALEALEAWEAEHGRGGDGGRVRTLTRGEPLVLANTP